MIKAPDTLDNMLNLRDLSYYRTGGKARSIVAPSSSQELQKIILQAKHSNIPLLYVGGGTNSLISDDDFPGIVIIFNNLCNISVTGEKIIAEAGVSNTLIAQTALDAKLSGASWMYRLPGQLGGTVRMNARCYGGEISQIASRITSITLDGQIKHYTDKKIFRGYKDTVFMSNHEIILSVELSLRYSLDTNNDRKDMLSFEKDRVDKGQFLWPSCGCVFKNDYQIGVPSGVLLENAGLKGKDWGRAQVSENHANFVFNKGGTSHDILELTFYMQEQVYERFGVWLKYEMELLGHLDQKFAKRYELAKPSIPKWGLIRPLQDAFKSK